MKKKFSYGMMMALSCVLLTGCHLKHEWLEATCTEPKTCTVGGETEGEALGHTWTEATCALPKTCSVCGETEGEPLGHGALTEANYQQAPVCTVCGETVGEPLTADFEKWALTCHTDFDTPHTYEAPCYYDESLITTGTVTFTDYMLTDRFELFDVPEGYVVQAITIIQDFTDENAQNYSFRSPICNEDYYNITGHDDSFVTDDDNIDTYAVSFNGKDYTECHSYIQSSYLSYEKRWIRFYFCVPEGYDGTVVGVGYDDDAWEDGMHIYDVANDNTVFFRLPAASGEPVNNAAKSLTELGITIDTEENTAYDYIGLCSDDTAKTLASLTFSDYRITENEETLENIDGYEWRSVHATVVFSDENAQMFGVYYPASRFIDFYNDALKINSLHNNDDKTLRLYTVNYNGTDYVKCAFFSQDNWDTVQWKDNTYTVETDFYFRVPIGYDGAVVCFYDRSLIELTTEELLMNESSVLFRLD